ncbi:MAG: hypothetical protein QM692_08870 [Thermomicrobiales bacterium]
MTHHDMAAAPLALLATGWTISQLVDHLGELRHTRNRRLEQIRFITCDDDIRALRALQIEYEHIMAPGDWAALGDMDAWATYAETRLLDAMAAAPAGSLILVGDLGGGDHLVLDRLAIRCAREALAGRVAVAGPVAPDLAAWRRQRQSTPLPSYSPRPLTGQQGGARQALQAAMERWGALASTPETPPGTVLRLAQVGVSPEDFHAWEPLEPVLQAYDVTGDPQYLAAALALAGDWLAWHMASAPAPGAIPPVAWRPQAVKLRSARLAYLVDVLARQPAIPDATVQFWLECAETHLTLTDQQSTGKRQEKRRGAPAVKQRFN